MRVIAVADGLRCTRGMITVGVIRNGSTYLTHHLRKNDYWQEGEKEVVGEWIGHGAQMLGLEGAVTNKSFDALRRNRHPDTGKRLTARENKARMALFDIQLSAPKDVSVLAMVGGDDRVRAAFFESAKTIVSEMERYAAVRERRGDARNSESFRLTGNFVGAMFLHDASRDLDPQLHVHVVLANATWDADLSRWMALQHAEIMRASPYLRQAFYRELAGRLHQLGYETHGMSPTGFSVRGVEHLRERFSKRARQVQNLADEFARKKGRKPTQREVEVLVRESRASKLTEVTTPEVRARQRAELSSDEARALTDLVARASIGPAHEKRSHGNAQEVGESALRHVYERRSVARQGDVLSAALELHPNFDDWRGLREVIESHPALIRQDGEMTTQAIRRAEAATIRRVEEGRNTRFTLGDSESLPPTLTPGQRVAATALLASTDFVSVLVGDAGTGKTTVLTTIEHAHQAAGGLRFLPLAPTTKARDALANAGFADADTVQRFLASEALQATAARRVVLVDEAGLLSSNQLEALTRIAHEKQARVLLVGDTKQHYSVRQGDALRNVVKHTHTPVVQLSEVLRQRAEPDRRFSEMLASGNAVDAFLFAERRGMIEDAGEDETLFGRAAEHYAANLACGVDTLVVIPFWDEIERFNGHARAALRRSGQLGEAEVTREAVKPLSWTEEQKLQWGQYKTGDRLLFVRDTRFLKRGMSAEVVDLLPDGLRVRGPNGRVSRITKKQRGAYEVGRAQMLPVAAGDRVLIRGRDDTEGFANGDLKTVASVDAATNEVTFTDGHRLPADFRAWTYGHAVTAYRAQGSTAEASLLVLGEVSARALVRRQFYVGNTRFRGAHRIYVSDREAILARLARDDPGRELATEFVARQRLTHAEFVSNRRLTRMKEHLRRALRWATRERWRQHREAVQQKVGI